MVNTLCTVILFWWFVKFFIFVIFWMYKTGYWFRNNYRNLLSHFMFYVEAGWFDCIGRYTVLNDWLSGVHEYLTNAGVTPAICTAVVLSFDQYYGFQCSEEFSHAQCNVISSYKGPWKDPRFSRNRTASIFYKDKNLTEYWISRNLKFAWSKCFSGRVFAAWI